MGRLVSFFVLVSFVNSTYLFAQQLDTFLIRNAGTDAMRNAIMGDTLSDGRRAHPDRVYVLQRGQRYINSAAIVTNGYHLRIVGESAPASDDPGPAVVQFAPDSTGHYDADRLLDLHGDATLENIWFLAWVSNGHQLWEPILEEADSSRLMIDHCIFEWMQGPAIHIASKWTTAHLENDLFRNANYTNEWWAGRVIYYTAPCDSLIEINNTIVNVGFGLLQSQGTGLNYFFCDHNTVVNCAKFCFLESYYKKAYISNNLFVNCHFAAERMQDRPHQDPDLLLYGQVLNVDTLMTAGRTLKPKNPEELKRVVLYSNNSSYFDTTDFYSFYRLYNDTVKSKTRLILPEPVMNNRTIGMFAWHPYMIDHGSVDGEDPLFAKMPDNLRLILSFLTDRYSPNPKNNILWGYDPDSLNRPDARESGRNLVLVYNNSSNGNYSTPEDFSYSNSKLLSAGINNFPVGDLNWFPRELTVWNVNVDMDVLQLLSTEKVESR